MLDNRDLQTAVKNSSDVAVAGLLATDGVEIVKVHDAPPENFCVVGERCSGTNLMQVLVKRKLSLNLDGWGTYGWKHGFPQKVGYAKTTLLIVMFRDPVTWIKSLYRKPWHATLAVQKQGFSEFIRGPWDTTVSPPDQFGVHKESPLGGAALQFDRHPIDGTRFENPLLMRNVKNRAFLGLRNREVNIAFVRMESLIQDPKLVLTCLSIAFNLPTPVRVQLPDKILGKYSRRVPLELPAPKDLSSADQKFISGQLDLKTEALLGYSV